jgi:hypothetical protein
MVEPRSVKRAESNEWDEDSSDEMTPETSVAELGEDVTEMLKTLIDHENLRCDRYLGLKEVGNCCLMMTSYLDNHPELGRSRVMLLGNMEGQYLTYERDWISLVFTVTSMCGPNVPLNTVESVQTSHNIAVGQRYNEHMTVPSRERLEKVMGSRNSVPFIRNIEVILRFLRCSWMHIDRNCNVIDMSDIVSSPMVLVMSDISLHSGYVFRMDFMSQSPANVRVEGWRPAMPSQLGLFGYYGTRQLIEMDRVPPSRLAELLTDDNRSYRFEFGYYNSMETDQWEDLLAIAENMVNGSNIEKAKLDRYAAKKRKEDEKAADGKRFITVF